MLIQFQEWQGCGSGSEAGSGRRKGAFLQRLRGQGWSHRVTTFGGGELHEMYIRHVEKLLKGNVLHLLLLDALYD